MLNRTKFTTAHQNYTNHTYRIWTESPNVLISNHTNDIHKENTKDGYSAFLIFKLKFTAS